MRKIAFMLLAIVFVSCSLDSELQTVNTPVNPNWSLIEASGGVAGTTTDFQANQITWTFDEFNGSLEVVHNTSGVSAALDPGTYDYRIENSANADFLFINNVEYGAITINVNRFTIDQNTTSDGSSVSDKFEYVFTR